jgi:hypothetical protein
VSFFWGLEAGDIKDLFRGFKKNKWGFLSKFFSSFKFVQIFVIKTMVGFEFGSGSRLDPDLAKPGSRFSKPRFAFRKAYTRFSKAWIRIQQKPESGSNEPWFNTMFKREGGPSISRIITFDSGRREECIVDGEKEGEQGLPGLSFHHLTR